MQAKEFAARIAESLHLDSVAEVGGSACVCVCVCVRVCVCARGLRVPVLCVCVYLLLNLWHVFAATRS